MKARIKATGEILEIAEYSTIYLENYDSCFYPSDLEFLDVKEKSFPKDSPDYWTRLEHQYAGMAMQGILSNQEYVHSLVQRVADEAIPNLAEGITKYAEQLAHALVEKIKEERK